MMIVCVIAFLLGLTGAPQNSLGNPRQDQTAEVANVLNQLAPALN
jgi:hypothetical protein